MINNIAFNEKDKVNTSEVITNHMLKNSKPIRLFHISKALSEVYTKTASKVTGKDAYKFVEKTVERNIERAKRMFNEDAINDFYAYDDAEKFDMEEFGLEEREEL